MSTSAPAHQRTSRIFKGKQVAVVGLARSGAAAADVLLRQGAKVWVTEQAATPDVSRAAEPLRRRGARVELGGHTEEFIAGRDLIVVSPGVPPASRPIQWAGARGIPIISEVELAFRLCRAPVIAVTGSNGKSTVTTLIGQMLAASGRRAVVCGNIGWPFLQAVQDLNEQSWACVETSSFQLEHVETFQPHIAVLLNITPNHLERHETFEAYQRLKARIFRQQGRDDFAVINADDFSCLELLSSCRAPGYLFSRQIRVEGAFLSGDTLMLAYDHVEAPLVQVKDLWLPGGIGIENALAASLAAALAGAPVEAIRRALRAFRGLPHRFESVAAIRDVQWINDSKATTPEAALRAIESCPGPVVLIAGGRAKGCDYRQAIPMLQAKVKEAVLIGEAEAMLASAWQEAVRCTPCHTLEAAVQRAAAIAGPGETVLLAPMCASFDQFEHFEARGDRFKRLVQEMEQRCVASAS